MLLSGMVAGSHDYKNIRNERIEISAFQRIQKNEIGSVFTKLQSVKQPVNQAKPYDFYQQSIQNHCKMFKYSKYILPCNFPGFSKLEAV